MRKAVQEYIAARDGLFRFFGCAEQYPVRTATHAKWMLPEKENVSFLVLFDAADAREEYVAVRKEDKPLVYKNGDYTMVIAIDCVKTAFVLKNSGER